MKNSLNLMLTTRHFSPMTGGGGGDNEVQVEQV